MKRLILLLLFSISLLVGLVAQEADFAGHIGNLNMDDGLTFDNRYSGVKGSPYIFTEFQRATIFTSSSRAMEASYLNFDRHARELLYKPGSEESAIRLNKNLIDSFFVYVPEDTLRFERLALETQADYLYMERLYAGKTRLYLDYGKTFNEADYVDPYSADRRYDEFKERPAFYVQLDAGSELLEIKKSKKQFSAFFGSSAKQILDYMKAEKTSLKSKSDLISLISYYDSLRN
jgi:hypothetical protein